MSDPAMILDAPYNKLTDGELLTVHFQIVVEVDRLRRTDDQDLLDEFESIQAMILDELRSRGLLAS